MNNPWNLKKVAIWRRCIRFRLVVNETNWLLLTGGRYSQVVVKSGLTVFDVPRDYQCFYIFNVSIFLLFLHFQCFYIFNVSTFSMFLHFQCFYIFNVFVFSTFVYILSFNRLKMFSIFSIILHFQYFYYIFNVTRFSMFQKSVKTKSLCAACLFWNRSFVNSKYSNTF